MTCSSAITPLTCADGGSHSITALGCCDGDPDSITPYRAAPAPFVVMDVGHVGSIRYNLVTLPAPPSGSADPHEIVIPDDGFVITPYEVLGFPPIDQSGQVTSVARRVDGVTITTPGGSTGFPYVIIAQ